MIATLCVRHPFQSLNQSADFEEICYKSYAPLEAILTS
jgi:hypothetical protein